MPMADLNSVGFVEKHFYHISPSLQAHFRLQIDDMWWVTNSSRKIWQMHCNEQKEDREGALCMTSLRFTMFPIQQILVPQTILLLGFSMQLPRCVCLGVGGFVCRPAPVSPFVYSHLSPSIGGCACLSGPCVSTYLLSFVLQVWRHFF